MLSLSFTSRHFTDIRTKHTEIDHNSISKQSLPVKTLGFWYSCTLFSHDALTQPVKNKLWFIQHQTHVWPHDKMLFFNADLSIYSVMLQTLHYLHIKAQNILFLHGETWFSYSVFLTCFKVQISKLSKSFFVLRYLVFVFWKQYQN